MSWLDAIDGPSDAELWAIELEGEVLDAELRLVNAEAALFAQPSKAAAAAFLRALLDVVDLHDFTDHVSGDDEDLDEVVTSWRVAS